MRTIFSSGPGSYPHSLFLREADREPTVAHRGASSPLDAPRSCKRTAAAGMDETEQPEEAEATRLKLPQCPDEATHGSGRANRAVGPVRRISSYRVILLGWTNMR